MNSFKIYKATFRFTLMKIVSGLVGLLLIVGLPIVAFLLCGDASDEMCIGVCLGAFIVACIVVGLLSHFVGYAFRAGQISVAANAIATGSLPENAYAEGKQAVKRRFGTVAVFYAIESIINSIVHQLTNGVTKLTEKLGEKSKNDTVKTVGAIVNIVISAMLKFMCSCCMGWVFIHPDTNAWRAACDGAIVYFKNWKALLKNTGKVIAFGVISLIIIGGLMFGAAHGVLHNMPTIVEMADELTEFIAEVDTEEVTAALTEDEDSEISEEEAGEFVEGLKGLSSDDWRYIFEAVVALILWGILHSALVDPYIMISVMNRYITDGLANQPSRDVDQKLIGMSKSYKKALAKAEAK